MNFMLVWGFFVVFGFGWLGFGFFSQKTRFYYHLDLCQGILISNKYFKCKIIPQFQFQIHHQGQQFLLQKEQTRLSCKTRQIYRIVTTCSKKYSFYYYSSKMLTIKYVQNNYSGITYGLSQMVYLTGRNLRNTNLHDLNKSVTNYLPHTCL